MLQSLVDVEKDSIENEGGEKNTKTVLSWRTSKNRGVSKFEGGKKKRKKKEN